MLTKENLKKILEELLKLDELGCTYDFKERFSVALSSLETLGLVKVIRTRVPKCDDHCEKYNDCQWIPIFERRKSIAKFKLAKEGLSLANFLLSDLSPDVFIDAILEAIYNSKMVDIILFQLKEKEQLTIEGLITTLLDQTTMKLKTIRITMRDILDLLESLKVLQIKEGILSPLLREQ